MTGLGARRGAQGRRLVAAVREHLPSGRSRCRLRCPARASSTTGRRSPSGVGPVGENDKPSHAPDPADLPFLAWTAPSIRTQGLTAAQPMRSGPATLTLLSSLVDADVVWHVPGRHGMARDMHSWRGSLLRPKGFWLSEQIELYARHHENRPARATIGRRRRPSQASTRTRRRRCHQPLRCRALGLSPARAPAVERGCTG